MQLQLDLFNDYTEMDQIKMDLSTLKEHVDDVRKGIFARHNNLAKQYLSLRFELEEMKMEIERLKNG